MGRRRTPEPAAAAATAALTAPASEREPDDWPAALRSPDAATREDAVGRLHALLLRAARFEAHRRGAARPELREHLDDLAQQCADDALVAVLAKLDGFRGESRFTTWAYKFAILETAVALRRHEWQRREVVLEDDGWPAALDAGAGPARTAESRELLAALREAIARDLTPHQRHVLVAVTLNGVPIDVLAERLTTTRGALYKTLHDARGKLRARLGERGFDVAAVAGGGER